jgi:hypothetical protein
MLLSLLASPDRDMLRYTLPLAPILASPLKAQAVTAPDSAAIIAAALTLTPKPEGSSAKPSVRLRGDTATVTVWLNDYRGQVVRVERRAGQWVAVVRDTTTLLLIRPASPKR